MYIKVRGLNSDEIYCCDKKDVLRYFGQDKEEDLFIVFGGGVRSRKENNNNDYFRKEYGVKGRILCCLSIYYERDFLGNSVHLGIYILHKDSESEEIKCRFGKEVLSKLYGIYCTVKAGDKLKETEHGSFNAFVCYRDNEFFIEERWR